PRRYQAGLNQLAPHLLVGLAVQVGEKRNLDRRETFQMNFRPDALETAQQLQVVVEREIRMQSVDDMDFGERLLTPCAQLRPGLFERHRVRARIAGAKAGERAER